MFALGSDEVLQPVAPTPAEPVDRVTAEPGSIMVDALAPGVGATRTVLVTNDSSSPVTIAFVADESGLLAQGPTPLEITYEWDDAQAVACGYSPAIPAGVSLEVQVVAMLPVEAGNEYQGLDAVSVLTFTAAAIPDSGCPVPPGPIILPVPPVPGPIILQSPTPSTGHAVSEVTNGPGEGGATGELPTTGADLAGAVVAVGVLVAAGTALLRFWRGRAEDKS